jgi:hypothetical protein
MAFAVMYTDKVSEVTFAFYREYNCWVDLYPHLSGYIV